MEVSECTWCKSKFQSTDAYFNKHGFCSENCFMDSLLPENYQEINHPHRDGLKLKGDICVICGALHTTQNPYCSKECEKEYLRLRPKYKVQDQNKYCKKFNSEFKIRVLAFFGNKCFVCGKGEKENGKQLSIHHVNYDKKVLCNGRKPLFVPLCSSCHQKTNTNREQWENFFENTIRDKYNYKCYLTKDELYSLGAVLTNLPINKDAEIKKLQKEIEVLKMHRTKLLYGIQSNTKTQNKIYYLE